MLHFTCDGAAKKLSASFQVFLQIKADRCRSQQGDTLGTVYCQGALLTNRDCAKWITPLKVMVEVGHHCGQ